MSRVAPATETNPKSTTAISRRLTLSRLVARVALAVVGSGVSMAFLAGCGSGQVSQTARDTSAVQGVQANVGSIAIRNAYAQLPNEQSAPQAWRKGDSVPLAMVISNNGRQGDQLESVTSTAARKVGLHKPTSPSKSTSPNATDSSTASMTSSPSAGASPNGQRSPSPSANSVTASPNVSEQPAFKDLGDPVVSLAIDHSVRLVEGDGQSTSYLVLSDLKKPLSESDTVTVTLTFQRAGSVTLKLPLAGLDSPRPRTSLTHR